LLTHLTASDIPFRTSGRTPNRHVEGMNDALLPLYGLHEPIANAGIWRHHVESVGEDDPRSQLADLHHEPAELAGRRGLAADDL
jgi:hypothetical protein